MLNVARWWRSHRRSSTPQPPPTLPEHPVRAATGLLAAYISATDALTGLLAHGMLLPALEAQGADGRPGAVMLLDIDYFKLVNDRFGHVAGDEVLRTVADRIRTGSPAAANVFRVGGDEFAVLLGDCDLTAAAAVARSIAAAVAEPMSIHGSLRVVTVTIGVARTPRSRAHHGPAVAEACMYQAKVRASGGVLTEDEVDERRGGRHDVVQQLHQLQDQRDALAVRAITDELTGLPNRRAFDGALLRVHAEAEREGRPYAVVYLDLDRFHDLNRARGDAAGDDALRTCAQALTGACRTAADVVYRKGGEELVALLPGTGRTEARVVAERMRLAVIAAGVPYRDDPASPVVTVSGGYICFEPDLPRSADAVVAAANRAMVLAKEQGRNRIVEG